MRTELIFPSQVGMIQTQIDYLDESARPGTLLVGPFDVLTREAPCDR